MTLKENNVTQSSNDPTILISLQHHFSKQKIILWSVTQFVKDTGSPLATYAFHRRAPLESNFSDFNHASIQNMTFAISVKSHRRSTNWEATYDLTLGALKSIFWNVALFLGSTKHFALTPAA